MIRSVLLLGILAIAACPAAARPFNQSDLVSLMQMGDATVSKDGQWLVWEQSEESLAANKAQHSLWRLDLKAASAAPEKLAFLDHTEPTDPEFGADGRLYFLSHGPSSQESIYRVSMDDLRPSLIETSNELSGFRVSPTGEAILAWADRPPHALSLDDRSKAPIGPGSARIYDHLPIRHWNRWADGNRSQLFFIAIREGNANSGQCALAPSFVADVPGGRQEMTWAPDGKTVYFSLRQAGRIEPLSTNSDIYEKSVSDCSKAPVNLTAVNKAADELPTVSPDGRWLAWVATARPGYADDRRVVWLRELATGKVHPLTNGWDRSVDSIAWSPDSRTLYVTAYDTLDHPIFSVGVADGVVRRLTGSGHTSLIGATSDGAVIFEKDGLLEPPDLWRRTFTGKFMRLTAINAAKLAGVDWPEVTRFTFAGAGRDKVWGLSLRPPGLAPGKKVPIALVVHGGPQATLGDAWLSRWPLNLALYADHGYGVVSIDFHGSTGYGQAFTDSVNREWGGRPLVDLRLGLASAIARFDYLDGSDACAVGASYGGYMMNWIEGHWPHRFKCLVQHDGVFDERGMTYETDELAPDRWDFGNKPYYADRTYYERWNPVNSVTKWQTPQLVITGEQDFRSPTGQAIAAFTALQERDIPSRLLVFPDEGHYEVKAGNCLQWYDQVFAWMDKWTSLDAAK
jgi:dipeptidyl aminopeptidase/acylaminoacyl peptidase